MRSRGIVQDKLDDRQTFSPLRRITPQVREERHVRMGDRILQHQQRMATNPKGRRTVRRERQPTHPDHIHKNGNTWMPASSTIPRSARVDQTSHCAPRQRKRGQPIPETQIRKAQKRVAQTGRRLLGSNAKSHHNQRQTRMDPRTPRKKKTVRGCLRRTRDSEP